MVGHVYDGEVTGIVIAIDPIADPSRITVLWSSTPQPSFKTRKLRVKWSAELAPSDLEVDTHHVGGGTFDDVVCVVENELLVPGTIVTFKNDRKAYGIVISITKDNMTVLWSDSPFVTFTPDDFKAKRGILTGYDSKKIRNDYYGTVNLLDVLDT